MTMQDFLVVGAGTLIMLAGFLIYGWVRDGGSINVWPIVRRYVAVRMLSDGAEDDYAGAGTGADWAVPPQQHQAASELVPDFLMVKDYLTDHTLTDEEAIELLALARRSNGDDLISANKIRDIVGGNEAKVKAHVAAHRKPRPKPRAIARIERPVNGWN